MNVTIYHNPLCGTSRKTLEIIRENGFEPTVVEYLKAPPTRAELQSLYEEAGMSLAMAFARRNQSRKISD